MKKTSAPRINAECTPELNHRIDQAVLSAHTNRKQWITAAVERELQRQSGQGEADPLAGLRQPRDDRKRVARLIDILSRSEEDEIREAVDVVLGLLERSTR